MEAGFIAAFIAGTLTFFATCLIPVLPAYIGYLGGSAVSISQQKSVPFYRRQVFVNSLFFSLAFILVFMVMAMAATSVGNILSVHRVLLQRIGGVFLILMGVYMLEIIKIPILFKSWQFHPSDSLRTTKLGSFIFGLTFGFAWTPCIGPVLATLIFFASQSATQLYGVSLLFVFGVGLAIPFVIIGAAFQSIQPWLKKVSYISNIIRIISAAIIIIAGILLVVGNLPLLSHWFLEIGYSPVLEFEGF